MTVQKNNLKVIFRNQHLKALMRRKLFVGIKCNYLSVVWTFGRIVTAPPNNINKKNHDYEQTITIAR